MCTIAPFSHSPICSHSLSVMFSYKKKKKKKKRQIDSTSSFHHSLPSLLSLCLASCSSSFRCFFLCLSSCVPKALALTFSSLPFFFGFPPTHPLRNLPF